jgi:hypothetical protein
MGEKLAAIGQSSSVQLGFVVVLLGVACWAGSAVSKAEMALSTAQTAQASLQSIDQRLSRIEGALGIQPGVSRGFKPKTP